MAAHSKDPHQRLHTTPHHIFLSSPEKTTTRSWKVRCGDVMRCGTCVGLIAVPSRAAQRPPYVTAHDVAEIDAEVREALTTIAQRQAA